MDVFSKIADKLSGKQGVGSELETAADQSPDEIKLVAWVKSKVDDSRLNGSRVANESIWLTNIAYLIGYSHVYWDATMRQFRAYNNDYRFLRRSRLHVNKLLPRAQNRLSRLVKNPPKYDIRPNSNSVDDKEAARIGIDIINHIFDKQQVDAKRQELVMWAQQCGYAFLKVCWDDELGEIMIDPVTNEITGFEGDVRIEVVSPFEVYADPMAKSMDDCSWVVQAKVRKLDYFKDRYERGYLVKEEEAWLISTQYENRINALNQQGTASTNAANIMKNSAIELSYYEKPSLKHPRGRQIICAGGILLEDKDLPAGEIPFIKFDDLKIAGKFQSESVITHSRPIQDQLNNLYNKRADWTNKMLAGKFIAARGHGLTNEALNNQSGEVVEYDMVPGSTPPQPMPIPAIPQYAYIEEERLIASLDDIFGINEISRGVLPAAGIPAVGMQFLQEQDETRIGVVTANHEYGYAQLAGLILKYVANNYKMPRKIKSGAKNAQYSVKQFVGSDLKDNFDVICIRGSTIPNSKVMKRQELLNAYQRGLLGNPQDPMVRAKLLDALEFGDVASAWEDQALDDAQIKRDIEALEQGIEPDRSEFDNHEWHLLMKNRYRKSEKFLQLDPLKQKMFMDDIEFHIQALVNRNNPMIHQDMMMANEMVNTGEQMSPDQVNLENPNMPVPPEGQAQ